MPAREPKHHGYFKRESSSVPAAGANPTITVPTGEWWLVHGASVRLTTDANAANRRPALSIASATTLVLAYAGTTIPASQSDQDLFWRKIGAIPTAFVDGNLGVAAPLPFPADEGMVVSLLTTSIQVGDQYSALHLWVEKF